MRREGGHTQRDSLEQALHALQTQGGGGGVTEAYADAGDAATLTTSQSYTNTALTAKQDTLPGVVGKQNQILAVNATETGLQWVAQTGTNALDLTVTPNSGGNRFLKTTNQGGGIEVGGSGLPQAYDFSNNGSVIASTNSTSLDHVDNSVGTKASVLLSDDEALFGYYDFNHWNGHLNFFKNGQHTLDAGSQGLKIVADGTGVIDINTDLGDVKINASGGGNVLIQDKGAVVTDVVTGLEIPDIANNENRVLAVNDDASGLEWVESGGGGGGGGASGVSNLYFSGEVPNIALPGGGFGQDATSPWNGNSTIMQVILVDQNTNDGAWKNNGTYAVPVSGIYSLSYSLSMYDPDASLWRLRAAVKRDRAGTSTLVSRAVTLHSGAAGEEDFRVISCQNTTLVHLQKDDELALHIEFAQNQATVIQAIVPASSMDFGHTHLSGFLVEADPEGSDTGSEDGDVSYFSGRTETYITFSRNFEADAILEDLHTSSHNSWSSGEVTVGATGIYMINFSGGAHAANNLDLIRVRLKKETSGVVTNVSIATSVDGRGMSGGSIVSEEDFSRLSANNSCIVSLLDGDKLKMTIEGTAPSGNLTMPFDGMQATSTVQMNGVMLT